MNFSNSAWISAYGDKTLLETKKEKEKKATLATCCNEIGDHLHFTKANKIPNTRWLGWITIS